MTQLKKEPVYISIAKQFTTAPGFRFRDDGPYSGQEFRETYLEPHFSSSTDQSVVTIDFDGVAGYATSFLEEAFGGLAREHGRERCIRKLAFISKEDPFLIEEVKTYIDEVE